MTVQEPPQQLSSYFFIGHVKTDKLPADKSFLVVVVNQWRQYRTKLPFVTAAFCALGFFFLLGKENFLLPTLFSCLAILLLLRGPIEKKEGMPDA